MTSKAAGNVVKLRNILAVQDPFFGAKVDGATDDTAAWTAAVDALNAAGGGDVFVGVGTSLVSNLTWKTGVYCVGQGEDVSIIKQKANTDGSVVTSQNFAALSAGGLAQITDPHDFGFRDITIDGNRANQVAGANQDLQNGLTIYGYDYIIEDTTIRNCFGHGIRAEWGTSGDFPMESHYERIVVDTVGRRGIWFKGPHDSNFEHIIVVDAGQQTDATYEGIYVTGNGGGRFFNCHEWHRSTAANRMSWAFKCDNGSVQLIGCHHEGGRQQLSITSANCSVVGNLIYAPYSTNVLCIIAGNFHQMAATEILCSPLNTTARALQLGVVGNAAFGCNIQVATTGAHDYAIDLVNDGGTNNINAVISGSTNATALYTGARHTTTNFWGTRSNGGGVLTLLETRGLSGIFTPTVTFSTPGDFAPTYVGQTGYYIKTGNVCHFSLSITFNTNAYTTAAGTFRIGGLPFAATANGPAATGRMDNVTLAGAETGAHVRPGAADIQLVGINSGAGMTFFGTTQIPPSTNNILIEVVGTFPC